MRLARLERAPSVLVALAGRPQHELEFLPAALEIIEMPAPPAARLIPATICAFFTVAIAWSVIGRIDIVANAPGTVIPAGKVKLVQPPSTAVVEQILVADGDHVEAGQPVVRLDAVAAVSARDKVVADLARATLDVAGLRALRDSLMDPGETLSFVAPVDAMAAGNARERATIAARQSEQQAKLATLTQQMTEKRVEASENISSIDKLRSELPMLAGVRDMYHKLDAMRLASRIDVLNSDEKYSDAVHDLAMQIEHGGEAKANLAALARQYEAQQADYAHGVLQDLADAEQKRSEGEAQFRGAAHEADAMVLRAPVAGTVQQVSVHSVRGVVTPAETLMVVVPDAQKLIVEAMVANRDIGFVHAGQAVNVKVAAYSFTRYGLIPGHVVRVSSDAVDDAPKDAQDQPAAANSGNVKQAAGSEPDLDGGQGSGYVAQIALDRDSVMVEHRLAKLEPGMSVTAEILTGKRRVISYLLSPMMRYTQDAVKER